MTAQRRQSRLSFRMMALEFRLRDRLRPPAAILGKAGLRPGMWVLDFGCGPGGFTLAAARIVGPTGRVHALDIHPLAIATVRGAAARQGLGNIRVISDDGLAGMTTGSLDFILLYDVLHDLQEPGPILAEFQRLLKPQGLLSVSDHHLAEADLLAAIIGGGFHLVGRGRRSFQFSSTGSSEGVS
jgi:2-polyprenyl-3-methyl-5-hydroxy-6-metoxy-1,4-benzoquinol methylase